MTLATQTPQATLSYNLQVVREQEKLMKFQLGMQNLLHMDKMNNILQVLKLLQNQQLGGHVCVPL